MVNDNEFYLQYMSQRKKKLYSFIFPVHVFRLNKQKNKQRNKAFMCPSNVFLFVYQEFIYPKICQVYSEQESLDS